jgi:hypothetical protein
MLPIPYNPVQGLPSPGDRYDPDVQPLPDEADQAQTVLPRQTHSVPLSWPGQDGESGVG